MSQVPACLSVCEGETTGGAGYSWGQWSSTGGFSRSETHFVCVSKGDTMCGGGCGLRGEPASSGCRGLMTDRVFASSYIRGFHTSRAQQLGNWDPGAIHEAA